MEYLKSFGQFNDETLYIFDFDNTLADTPKYNDLVIDYLKENITIKELLNKSLRSINKEEKDLKIENGRIYIDDPEMQIKVKGDWVRKKSRVYLLTPNIYTFTEMSLPTREIKEITKIYRSVKNKAIVTGRPKKVCNKIKQKLEEFGLEYPNFGIHCFPLDNIKSQRVAKWKGNTIVDLIKKSGFKNANFYEDNTKWLKKSKQIVNQELPYINFKAIKVS